MLRRVYGKQKQGIGFGHAKVGGYDVSLSSPVAVCPFWIYLEISLAFAHPMYGCSMLTGSQREVTESTDQANK